MKKFYLLLMLFIASCVTQDEDTIDGCEYIKTTSNTGKGPVVSLTHKGNCSNPIHQPKRDTIYVPNTNQ